MVYFGTPYQRASHFYTLLTYNIDKCWYNNGKEKEMIA